MNKELVTKAKEAKNTAELIALGKENGIDLTEENAQTLYDYLHPKTGELSDEELDNVAGGGCYSDDGNLKTTGGYKCKHFEEGGRPDGVKGTCYRCRYWGNDPNAQCASLWSDVLELFMKLADVATPRQCYHPANRKK